MGRRAKHKQSDPKPLLDSKENVGKPSQKKLGKRKADADFDGAREDLIKRPAKKARESLSNGEKGQAKSKGKKVAFAGEAAPTPAKKTKGKHKEPVAEESEESEESDSDAWENVEDEDDVKAQARSVLHHNLLLVWLMLRCRSLFHDSDNEGFVGDLNDLDMEEYVALIHVHSLSY